MKSGDFLGTWSSRTESLPIKTRRSISYAILSSWDMSDSKSKTKACCYFDMLRNKCIMFGSGEVCELRMWTTAIVIDMKQDTPTRPKRTPDMGSQNNGEKFLASNWQRNLVWRPRAIEPIVAHKRITTNSTRRVRTNGEMLSYCQRA